jgi:hypothetical protein
MYLMVHGQNCLKCKNLKFPPPGSPMWTGLGATQACFASSICQTGQFTHTQQSSNCPTAGQQGWAMSTNLPPFFQAIQLFTARSFPCTP